MLIGEGHSVRRWEALRTLPWQRRALAAAIALALASLLLRMVALGQPEVDVDEQFYLLVGDRMLHGAIPYVGIWDRKPIGLFLIYAAARAFGGSGILNYQIAALISATATAWTVRGNALRLGATQIGALLAGLAYLLWLNLLGGVGGQAPVFFNLPMAIAGGLIIRHLAEPADRKALVRAGLGCMLLVGIAIQIKYTALFEGMYLGLALLVIAYRNRLSHLKILLFACAMIVVALAPTALAVLVYWSIGHAHEFLFANFLSIGGRLPLPSHEVARRAATLALVIVPLMILGILGPRFGKAPESSEQYSARWFVLLWLAAASASVIGFGYFFDHYGLPIVVPGAIAAAPFLSNFRRFGVFILGLFATALIAGQVLALDEISSSGGWRTVTAVERAGRGIRNCPFIYDGPAVVYVTAHWCTPTVYPFPYHLSYNPESKALGVDVSVELHRIMGTRPELVVIRRNPYPNENLAARALMLRELKRNYTPVASTPFHGSTLVIFRLKSGLFPVANARLP